MGYRVTALDISPGMLARLQQAADDEALTIDIVNAPAHEPPPGPFDAVMERVALWTLPDPEQALAAWREVAAGGLIAFESMIGRDYVEGLRRRARGFLARARRCLAEHHIAEPEVQRALPRMGDTSPSAFVQLIEAAGWQSPHVMRLRDVEWARQVALPPLDRLAGVTPEYVITAT